MKESLFCELEEIIWKTYFDYQRTNESPVFFPSSAQQLMLVLDDKHDHYTLAAQFSGTPKSEILSFSEEDTITAITYFKEDCFLSCQCIVNELDTAQQIGMHPEYAFDADEREMHIENAMQYLVRARNDLKIERALSEGNTGEVTVYQDKEYLDYIETRLSELRDHIEITRIFPENARKIIQLRFRANFYAEHEEFEKCQQAVDEIKSIDPRYDFKVRAAYKSEERLKEDIDWKQLE